MTKSPIKRSKDWEKNREQSTGVGWMDEHEGWLDKTRKRHADPGMDKWRSAQWQKEAKIRHKKERAENAKKPGQQRL